MAKHSVVYQVSKLMMLWLFIHAITTISRASAATGAVSINTDRCPEVDNLHFEPMVPQNPNVVYGTWIGKNRAGEFFQSSHAKVGPHDIVRPAGRRGKMLRKQSATQFSDGRVRCDYKLKNTHGHEILQWLIQQDRPQKNDADLPQAETIALKLELK